MRNLPGATLYRRTGDRRPRYEAAGYEAQIDALPPGAYLVRIQREDGCRRTSLTQVVETVTPERVAVLAAVEELRDEVVAALRVANRAEPTLHTERERQAWARFIAEVGPDWRGRLHFPGASAPDVVEAAVRVLRERLG